jgi:hypothetical protein
MKMNHWSGLRLVQMCAEVIKIVTIYGMFPFLNFFSRVTIMPVFMEHLSMWS